jgi:hypothetical protein
MMEGSGSRSGSIQIMIDPDPGGPKTYGSGTTTLSFSKALFDQTLNLFSICKSIQRSAIETLIRMTRVRIPGWTEIGKLAKNGRPWALGSSLLQAVFRIRDILARIRIRTKIFSDAKKSIYFIFLMF